MTTVVSQHTEQNTTNFKVILKSEYGTVERYCQNIMIPGVAVGKTMDSIGYTIVKQPGDKIEFDDLRFEILLDRELKSWSEIFNLMIEEVNPETGILAPKSVIFDTRIIMLDNTRNPFLEFQYINSFITKLDSFAVDTKKTENIAFGVEMCFESIRINYLTRSSYPEIPLAIPNYDFEIVEVGLYPGDYGVSTYVDIEFSQDLDVSTIKSTNVSFEEISDIKIISCLISYISNKKIRLKMGIANVGMLQLSILDEVKSIFGVSLKQTYSFLTVLYKNYGLKKVGESVSIERVYQLKKADDPIDLQRIYFQQPRLKPLIELSINPYANMESGMLRLKTDTHSHTTESDGYDYGAVRIDNHLLNGFDFLAITDHDRNRGTTLPRENNGVKYINTWEWSKFEQLDEAPDPLFPWRVPKGSYTYDVETGLSANGMLTTESVEISLRNHLILIGTVFHGTPYDTMDSALDTIVGTDTLAIMAHPSNDYYVTTSEDLISYYGIYDSNNLIGQEIVTGDATLDSVKNHLSSWDRSLTAMMPGRQVLGIGCTDMHSKDTTNTKFRGYTTVLSNTKTLEAWKASIREGLFFTHYDYNGSDQVLKSPTIDSVVYDSINETLKIISANSTSIKWISCGHIVSYDYELKYNQQYGVNKYVRAELYNDYGVTYTQPFGFIIKYNNE